MEKVVETEQKRKAPGQRVFCHALFKQGVAPLDMFPKLGQDHRAEIVGLDELRVERGDDIKCMPHPFVILLTDVIGSQRLNEFQPHKVSGKLCMADDERFKIFTARKKSEVFS